ncbi:lycopene e-cyclase isoprenoid transferase B [Microbacterium sp. SZ1]|uniref:lycopene cyclase domain-containing protein n=1 Tax=Microbacterium sp. SZ1 TaxID=1849736 RepID=UPI000BBB8F8B|nr:lycopene cyclase domain-containing protein [Microbacterium sp. SZ1]PCE16060.1 lycopene e-cyclase isoprenoid transferase B [Microbacterium sp. SZ1]
MTYLQLAAWFVGAAAIAAVLLALLTPRARRPRAAALAIAAVALILLTAVFDSIMIASGLFHYSPDHLLGVHIGFAPLEDFAYPIAGALLLPALWAFLRARRRLVPAESSKEADV